MAYNKKNTQSKVKRNFGAVEYLMSKTMAEALLNARKGETEKKMHPHDYLVKVVNENFGLLRECVKVQVY